MARTPIDPSIPMDIAFRLDGAPVEVCVLPKRSALDLLRDDLGQRSLNPGCAPQGICGCCVALVNGKPRVLCTLPSKSLNGKEVQTHAGLDPQDAALLAGAFQDAGGTQCGYCTAGIALSTHALLAREDHPSPEQVTKALGLHICRCTGWSGIRDSVDLAARRRAELRAGRTVRRPSQRRAPSPVLGQQPYLADMSRPGMWHAALVFVPAAHGTVLGVDTQDALALPGVHQWIAAEHTPDTGFWPLGAAGQGDGRVLGMVLATSQAAAEAGAAAVRVDHAAIAPGPEAAPLAEVRQVRGDPRKALAGAALVVEERFQTQRTDPAPLEPEACLAVPTEGAGLVLYSNGVNPSAERSAVCAALGLPPAAVRVVAVPTGGAFGTKTDPRIATWTAAAAGLTGRPVRLSLPMHHSTRFHGSRPAVSLRYRVGTDENGQLCGIEADICVDGGGIEAALAQQLAQRFLSHAAGPYTVAHVDLQVRVQPSAGPAALLARGVGAAATSFALEGCLDRLAALGAHDPVALRQAQVSPRAQDLLRALEPAMDEARSQGHTVGMALSALTPPHHPDSRAKARIQVAAVDQILVQTGFGDPGDGHFDAVARTVAHSLDLPIDQVHIQARAMSGHAAPSGPWGASGLGIPAARAAARQLQAAIDATPEGLSGLVGRVFEGEARPSAPGPAEPVAQLCVLNEAGAILRLIAAVHLPATVDPLLASGQVEGGLHMGVGLALSEELALDPTGCVDTRFNKLGVLKIRHSPSLRMLGVADPAPHDPTGAALGALGMVAAAPAIAAAIWAQDQTWHRALPMRTARAAKAAGGRPPRP